jgi:glycosyltransferase involved in cell wall biosynthesis
MSPETGASPRRLIVEGWRSLAHSYAMVNQWQLLALMRRTDVSLSLRDLPFYGRHWQAQDGLFDAQAEMALSSIAMAAKDARADVLLRIAFPFDFSPSESGTTAVFGTLESQAVLSDQIANIDAFDEARGTGAAKTIKVVTPSRWSAEGFTKAGFAPERVLVVPHGVDVETFHAMPDLRGEIRSKIGIAEDDFVFLTVGAMTGNKGIDLLFRAFSEVARQFPQARLLLKGMDPLYKSNDLLLKNLGAVPESERRRVTDRTIYYGDSFSNAQLAQLYQAADAYVSPYRAEGFNIPVLEAAASGIPVICTQGGATDDFVTDAFARRIKSEKVSARMKGFEVWRLEPDLADLTALMISAIEDRSWRQRAAKAGPAHVRAGYTWDQVVDILVRKLFP